MVITRKRYTLKDLKRLRCMVEKGKSIKEMASSLDRTEKAIGVFLSRMQWNKANLAKQRRPYTDKEDELIIHFRSKGFSNERVAEAFGRTESAISSRVCNLGLVFC